MNLYTCKIEYLILEKQLCFFLVFLSKSLSILLSQNYCELKKNTLFKSICKFIITCEIAIYKLTLLVLNIKE